MRQSFGKPSKLATKDALIADNPRDPAAEAKALSEHEIIATSRHAEWIA